MSPSGAVAPQAPEMVGMSLASKGHVLRAPWSARFMGDFLSFLHPVLQRTELFVCVSVWVIHVCFCGSVFARVWKQRLDYSPHYF